MLAAAAAITAMIVGALAPLGAVAAPLIGSIGAVGPVTAAGTAIAGLAGAGAAAGGSLALGAGAGAVGASPHAAVGVQNGINDALNNAKDGFAGSVNGLQVPGVPHISFN